MSVIAEKGAEKFAFPWDLFLLIRNEENKTRPPYGVFTTTL